MNRIKVNDIPVAGKFIVTENGKVLHRFDDTENEAGDISFDIAFRDVAYICEEHGYLNIVLY